MKKKAEESFRRKRGRPKKESQEKGGYSHILFKTSFFKPLSESPAQPEEEQQQRVAHYLDKIREICQETETAEYYWRLVFTATFHLYRERRQQAALEAGADNSPLITPSDMATHAGMEYFNLKNLFLGRGTARNVFHLLRFFHQQSIDFDQIQYNESIIDRAYAYLMMLRQDGMDPEEVKKLFLG